MKIAIIGTAYPYRGGLAIYNERLAQEFQAQGHDVTVYTFTVQYPNLLFPGKSQYSLEPRAEDLNIVACINSINPLNWWKIGRKISQQSPDLVVIKFWIPFMGPCFGTILKQINKGKSTKVISIIDNIIPHEARIGDKWFTRYFVKQVDAFVAMSKTVLEQINIFDQKKAKIYSPHPIFDNFGKIEPREAALAKLSLSPDYQYMLFFGLIRDYKGLDLLLQAFADARFRGSKIKLIVAGEYYTDRSTYDQLIQENQLADDIIQVDRFIEDSEVADYFNACDLLVQPYKTATQSGVTQIAYHFNKPMVVTNVGGLPEMCPDGKVGYVVPPEATAIADAMLRFFKATKKEEMVEYIIEEKKKYSWAILVQNVIRLAEQVKSKSIS